MSKRYSALREAARSLARFLRSMTGLRLQSSEAQQHVAGHIQSWTYLSAFIKEFAACCWGVQSCGLRWEEIKR